MFFKKDPKKLLCEVNPEILTLIRAGNYYEAIQLGHTTLHEIGHFKSPESWELQRLVAVAFYQVHAERIRDAPMAETYSAVLNAEEGKIALSMLERVRAEEAEAGLVNSATHFWLAMSYMGRREYEKVRELLGVIKDSPVFHPDYYSMLGRLAEMDGDDTEAKRHLRAAHRIDPNHWWVQVKLAQILNDDKESESSD